MHKSNASLKGSQISQIIFDSLIKTKENYSKTTIAYEIVVCLFERFDINSFLDYLCPTHIVNLISG